MANGTIAFDTLSTSGQITGTAKSLDTDYLASGSAKVWARIADENGSYLDSFNTASLTDSAVGKAVVVFTTTMSNANYSVSLAIGENFSEPNINSTSTANYEVWVYDEGASAYKDVTTHSSVLGDLA
jgi:hypothetical protein